MTALETDLGLLHQVRSADEYPASGRIDKNNTIRVGESGIAGCSGHGLTTPHTVGYSVLLPPRSPRQFLVAIPSLLFREHGPQYRTNRRSGFSLRAFSMVLLVVSIKSLLRDTSPLIFMSNQRSELKYLIYRQLGSARLPHKHLTGTFFSILRNRGIPECAQQNSV